MRVLIILLAALLAYFGWQWFKKGYAEQGRPFAVKTILVLLAVALIGLAMFGRVHWVGAAAAALLAGLRFALPILLKSLPFLVKLRESQAKNQTGDGATPAPQVVDLDENAALAILGLEKPYTREDIVAAHKRIIQNLHPDKGGSDFLASQVNAAKELLLKLLAQS